MGTNDESHFFGEIRICLWFRGPPHSQESGPPIPNYQSKCYGNDKVLNSGYTDVNGCISLPFVSTWKGNSLSVSCYFHNGSSGTFISKSDQYQIVDFERVMDSLPENFQPKYDCATCQVYYPSSNSASSSADSEDLVPLSDHECSTNEWGWNCCGYDWNTNQCRVQEFFPEFSFLHRCGACQVLHPPDAPDAPDASAEPPIDCSICDSYYPEDTMLSTSLGEVSSLENHACSHEDYSSCSTSDFSSCSYGPRCCEYDWETKQCGVFAYGDGRNPYHEGEFLYPCSGKCKPSSKLSGTVIAIIISSIIAVMVIALIGGKRLKKHVAEQQSPSPVHDYTNENQNSKQFHEVPVASVVCDAQVVSNAEVVDLNDVDETNNLPPPMNPSYVKP